MPKSSLPYIHTYIHVCVQSLRRELLPHGVLVTLAQPGATW